MFRYHSLEFLAVLTWMAIAAVPKDRLTFDVPAGTRQTKAFELRSALTSEESVLAFGDQEMNAGEGMLRERTLSGRVQDEYQAVSDGRPTRLQRTYEHLVEDTAVDAPKQANVLLRTTGPRTSLLEGCAALFEWDTEVGAQRVGWVEGAEGDPAWLALLREDMDFRGFLPEGPVAEGDRWELAPAVLVEVLSPGGRLFLEPPPEAPAPPDGVHISLVDVTRVAGWEQLEGSVVVRYDGQRERGGRRVAALAVRADVEGVTDAEEAFLAQGRNQGLAGVSYDLAELDRTLEGEGTLLWDLERNCLAAFEFEAEVSIAAAVEWVQDIGMGETELALHQLLSGTLALELETETATE